jgi:hypothetical protein
MSDYPNPTYEDLQDPVFEAVWQAIKGWDIGRLRGEVNNFGNPNVQRLCKPYSYTSAQGNDVMHILKAIEAAGWGFIHHESMDCPDSKPWSDE